MCRLKVGIDFFQVGLFDPLPYLMTDMVLLVTASWLTSQLHQAISFSGGADDLSDDVPSEGRSNVTALLARCEATLFPADWSLPTSVTCSAENPFGFWEGSPSPSPFVLGQCWLNTDPFGVLGEWGENPFGLDKDEIELCSRGSFSMDDGPTVARSTKACRGCAGTGTETVTHLRRYVAPDFVEGVCDVAAV